MWSNGSLKPVSILAKGGDEWWTRRVVITTRVKDMHVPQTAVALGPKRVALGVVWLGWAAFPALAAVDARNTSILRPD